MSELIENIFLTSLLVSLLSIGLMKFRDDYTVVGDTEKYTIVIVFLLSVATFIVTAFMLIWI